jgi:hypothetical protein
MARTTVPRGEGPVPTDAALALAALGALGNGEPGPPATALGALLANYGLAREADVIRAWLRDAAS